MAKEDRGFHQLIGQLALYAVILSILVFLAGIAKLCGITPQLAARNPFGPKLLPTPQYAPMAGLAYISPAQGECMLLRGKSVFEHGLPDLFTIDYTVCRGLQVEILESAWMTQGSSHCYIYLVRVPATTNVKGWIRQDELTLDLAIPPLKCSANP